MNELITATLELARLETHRGTLHKAKVDVSAAHGNSIKELGEPCTP